MPNIVLADGITSSSQLDLFAGSETASIKTNSSTNLGINEIRTLSNYSIFNFSSLNKDTIFSFQQQDGANTFRFRSGAEVGFLDFYAPLATPIYFSTNNTVRLTINSNGALGFGSTPNFGSSNQTIISQGSNAAPTWSTLDNSAIAANAGIVYSKLSLANSIVNADISSSAAIVDTKLATISTAGKVSNSATTATTSSTASSIVLRDANGYITNNYFNSSDDISTATITYIMAKFGDNYMRSATAAKVAAFLSGQSMNIAGNATTAGGLSVHSGRNNEANKIVRTDASGYLQLGYIHSSSGDENGTSFPTYIWGTDVSGDNYLRSWITSYVNTRFYASNGAYLRNNWDGGYWNITSSSGASVRVARADVGGATSTFSSASSSSLSSSGNIQKLSDRLAYAWVRITPTTNPGNLAIGSSYNVSSVTDQGTSQFDVNIPNRGTSRYFVAACNSRNNSYWLACSCYQMTATSVRIKSTLASGGWGTNSGTNPGFASTSYPGMSVIIY